MNRPLSDTDSDSDTKSDVAIVTGCSSVVMFGILCWIAMAGIYIYFGADKVPIVVLLNNTGQKLTITWDGQSHLLTSGNSIELPPRHSWAFVIQTEKGQKWSYNLAAIDQKDFYLQIEPDGSFHLLRIKSEQPSQNLPPQPKGYPLHPQ